MPVMAWLQPEDLSLNWVKLTHETTYAEGHIQPRIGFSFYAHTVMANTAAQFIHAAASLTYQNELIGRGNLTEPGGVLYSGENHSQNIKFEVPVSREALRFIDEGFRDNTLGLGLQITAMLNLRDDNTQPAGGANYEMKQWFTRHAKLASSLQISIARSDWYKVILEPLGVGTFVLMELRVPPAPEHERWKNALAHIHTAEERYYHGDDPGVFASCRAAFEALDGAPKHIFDQMTDEKKRNAVNDLLLKATDFFHSGRHVSATGPQQGTFPVDHRDAVFALGLAKMFLAYTSGLLSS